MSTSFKSSIFMVLAAVTANISSVSGLRCGKQSIYDNAAFFSCPRPYDDPGKVYCCGGGKFQGGSYCCTQIEHGVNKIGDSIGSIVGIVLAAVVLVLLVLMLFCCCCPCCLLHKNKKETGRYWGGPKRSPTPAGVMANGQTLMENYLQQQQYPQQYPMQQVLQPNQQGMGMGYTEPAQQAMYIQDQNGYIQQVSAPLMGQGGAGACVGQFPMTMHQQMFVPQQVQQPLLLQQGNFQELQNLTNQQQNVFQR